MMETPLEARLNAAVERLENLMRLGGAAALDGLPFDHRAVSDAETEVEVLSGANAELVHREREAAAKDEAEKIAAWKATLAEKAHERLEAIGSAEKAALELAEALRETLRLGGEMHTLAVQMGGPVPLSVNRPGAERWLSERVQAVLRSVTGHPNHFGKTIKFQTAYRKADDNDWVEGARKNIAGDLELLLKGTEHGTGSSEE